MRILSWDIETSNLTADFGSILCAGFREVGSHEKAQVISIADFKSSRQQSTNDKELVLAASKRLLDCDCWLTWFGTYFDIPYVNSRLLYHNLPLLPANFPHIDGWKVARNRLKLSNNRLNSVQRFLDLPDEKTHLLPGLWLKSLAGDKGALKYIVDHCRADVLVLEQAYERLRPLILDHPFSGGTKGECTVCGKGKLQKRGFHRTRTRLFQRFFCTSCGSWSKGHQPIPDGSTL